MLQPIPSERDRPLPPAAGRFGVDRGVVAQASRHRPAGCPSLDQFEEKFLTAGPRG